MTFITRLSTTMKTLIVTLTVIVFIALEVQGLYNYLHEDRDEVLGYMQEFGFEKNYTDKCNETMTRQISKFCDASMKDEAKVKQYQACDIEFIGKLTSTENLAVVQACTEEAYKGMTALDIRELECADFSAKYDAILKQAADCDDTKGGTNATSLLDDLKAGPDAVAKLKPIFESIIACHEAALG